MKTSIDVAALLAIYMLVENFSEPYALVYVTAFILGAGIYLAWRK